MPCDKETYSNHKLAMAAVKGLVSRGKKKLKSYKCKECEGYHIASINEFSKPRGRQQKEKWVKELPKKKSTFTQIKVTKQEIENGRKYKEPPTDLFTRMQILQGISI